VSKPGQGGQPTIDPEFTGFTSPRKPLTTKAAIG
jgi:hypothetical protein